jgi:hypothetical protein
VAVPAAWDSHFKMEIAFDTNIRLKRWESENQCRETILSYVKKADIVKMTEDELLFFNRNGAKIRFLHRCQLHGWDAFLYQLFNSLEGVNLLRIGISYRLKIINGSIRITQVFISWIITKVYKL